MLKCWRQIRNLLAALAGPYRRAKSNIAGRGYQLPRGHELCRILALAAAYAGVCANLSDLYGIIVEIVSAHRGDPLTWDKSLRSRHLQLVKNIPALLDTITGMAQDSNPTQLNSLATLRRLIELRLEILDKVLAAYDNQGLIAAQQAMIDEKGLETMNNIFAVIKTMEADESHYSRRVKRHLSRLAISR